MEQLLKSQPNKFPTCGNYIILKSLGEGLTSRIKLGYDPKQNQLYALKILKSGYTLQNDNEIRTEVQALCQIDHANVIKLYDIQTKAKYKSNGKTRKKIMLVLELASGGELFDYVANTCAFSEQVSRYYFQQLISGLFACHSAGYVHRDLKPENILFDQDFQLKLADFGFAGCINGRDGKGKLYTLLGTKAYMAPELLQEKPYCGASVDIFAAGLILFVMYSGGPPFQRAIQSDGLFQLFVENNDKFWSAHSRNKPGKGKFYPSDFRDLINRMLAFDPKKRIPLLEIGNHSWFKKPVPTKEEIRKEFTARYDIITQKRKQELRQQQQQQQLVSQGQEVHNSSQQFRDLPENLLNKLNLKTEFQMIEKNFPKIRSKERFLEPYFEYGLGLQSYAIQTKEQDLLELLVCMSSKISDQVILDEDNFSLKAVFKNNSGRINIDMSLYRKDKETLVIQFQRLYGNQFQYFKQVNEIRDLYLKSLVETQS